MEQNLGVPPSGSGHSAEPEPLCASAQGASVPNAGWTKGPWGTRRAVHADNTGGFDVAILAGETIIAEAFENVGYMPDGTTYQRTPVDANARIIAAAPEMAEMLSAVVNAYDRPDATPVSFNNAVISLVRDARALLARVREQP